MALKDRLLLTAEELRETAREMQKMEEEREKIKAAKPKRGCKRKAKEMETPDVGQVDEANSEIEA